MGCSSSSQAPADASGVRLQVNDAGAVLTPLFFPDACLPCRSYLQGQTCTRRKCKYSHEPTSLSRLLHVLNAAAKTLEVCVFCITCNEIADSLEAAAKRGVQVRIITDDEMAKTTGSDVERLSKVSGIQCRHDGNARSHMHHKFAIVDGGVLISGSFSACVPIDLTLEPLPTAVSPRARECAMCDCIADWTRAAVITNCENVIIVQKAPQLVQAFRDEFNRLWTAFAMNVKMPQPTGWGSK